MRDFRILCEAVLGLEWLAGNLTDVQYNYRLRKMRKMFKDTK